MTAKKFLLTLFTCALLVFWVGSASAYLYNSAWVPTNGHINITQYNSNDNNLILQFFDWDDRSDRLTVIDSNSNSTTLGKTELINVNPPVPQGLNPNGDQTYQIDTDSPNYTDSSADTLITDNDGWFGIVLHDSSSNTDYFNFYITDGGSDQWVFDIETGTNLSTSFIINDVSQAPIPSTLAFLIAGVFGLIPFGRKFKPE